MRRLITIVTAVFLILTVTSCTRDSGGVLSYQSSVTGAEVHVKCGTAEYSAIVTLDRDIPEDDSVYRKSSIEITSPAEIAGVHFSFEGNTAQIHCGDTSSPLADTAARAVYRIIRSLSLRDGELCGAGDGISGGGDTRSFRFECTEKDGQVSYDLTLDDDGRPTCAVIGGDGEDLRVDFVKLYMENADTGATSLDINE